MAETGEVDLSLAYSKCMEFCQALAIQGKAFHFSLNMGTNFSFSLDTRSKALAPQPVLRKKGSPSTQRRNAKRRMEFLNKKRQAPSSTMDSLVEKAAGSSFSCEHCDYTNSSERGLRQHQRMKHGKPNLVTQIQSSSPPTPESLRQPLSYSAALAVSPSPVKEVRDEVVAQDSIDCPECGKVFESEENLETHMDEHHPPTIVCNNCKGVFENWDPSQRPLNCPTCSVPWRGPRA